MTATISLRLGRALFVQAVIPAYLVDGRGGRAALHCLHNQPRTLRLLAARLEKERRKHRIAMMSGDTSLPRIKLIDALQTALVQVTEMLAELSAAELHVAMLAVRGVVAS